jgi:hypothetical protein
MGWKSGSFGLWDFPAPAEKAPDSKTWLEHAFGAGQVYIN